MKPRSWAPNRLAADLVASGAILVLPSLVAAVARRDGAAYAVPVSIFSIPTAVASALFANADRRAPLVASTTISVALLTWFTSVVDLTNAVRSDPQGPLVLLFIPLYTLPAAVLGGFAALGVDAFARRVLAENRSPTARGPYR